MENAVEEYLKHLESHGRKPVTIKNVFRTLSAVEKILGRSGWTLAPEDASVEAFLAVRNAPGLLDTSRSTYVHVYSKYIRWATGRDLVKEADMLWSKPEITTRRWITDEEFRILWLNSADDPRLRVVLALGAWLGLRRTEIATVRWEDIHGDRIIIRGKGHGPDGKIVSVLIPPAVRKALDAWRPLCPAEAETIVASYQPREVSYNLGPQAIGKMLKELGRRCDIEFTPHSLRRLYATELDERDVSPVQIAQLMRHSNIQTTYCCYLKPNRVKLDKIAAGVGDGYR